MRLVFAALLLVSACNADVTTTCVGGDGSCDTYPQSGALPADPCFSGCDVTAASGRTGQFPCAVEKILADNCRRCHTTQKPPLQQPPFELDTYEESQAIYFGMAIWARMKAAIDDDFMPLEPPKLTPEEKNVLVDDWVCKCAPPRAEGAGGMSEQCP